MTNPAADGIARGRALRSGGSDCLAVVMSPGPRRAAITWDFCDGAESRKLDGRWPKMSLSTRGARL